MTISQQEQYHAVAILRLVTQIAEEVPEALIRIRDGKGQSVYFMDVSSKRFLFGDKHCLIGLYVKHSGHRRGPWKYSFNRDHQKEILAMHKKTDAVFVVFVNHEDGFACIDYDELKEVLDEEFEEVENVTVARPPRGSYRISGRDGNMKKTLARKSFPDKVFRVIEDVLK